MTPTLPKVGDLIADRYTLTDLIGRGGFGVVYEARDAQDPSRMVALKMVHPRVVEDPSAQARFEREFRLMKGLTHPSAVEVYDCGVHAPEGTTSNLSYIAMERLQGATLRQFLRRRGPLTIDETRHVLLQVLGCLAEAHAMGIVHRDLKPANLFLCFDAPNTSLAHVRVKVLDFGIARAVTGEWGDKTMARLTAAGSIAGTPQFMAPEQLLGARDISPALDIYALGCIAYLSLSGAPPFLGRNGMETGMKHIGEPIPQLPPAIFGLTMAPIIRRALAKEASDRFADAAEMASAIVQRRRRASKGAMIIDLAQINARGAADEIKRLEEAPTVVALEPDYPASVSGARTSAKTRVTKAFSTHVLRGVG